MKVFLKERHENLCNLQEYLGAKALASTQMASDEQVPSNSYGAEKEFDKRLNRSKTGEQVKDLHEKESNLVLKNGNHEVQSEGYILQKAVKKNEGMHYKQRIVEDTWSRLCKELRGDRKQKKGMQKTESEFGTAVQTAVGPSWR